MIAFLSYTKTYYSYWPFFPKLLLDALKIAFLEEEKVSEDARGRNPLAHTKKDRWLSAMPFYFMKFKKVLN